jgi:ABC-type transporter Mla subunit MlaD
VLQSVQPQKLSVTLTAISTALRGRGAQLGQTLAQLGQYVGELNPQLPTLEHDLKALTETTVTYDQAAPSLLGALDDLTTTSQTLVDQRSALANLYSTVTNASDNLDNFISANQNDIISLSSTSRPTLDVLARYSPEYACFLKQMADIVPAVDKAFGKGTNQPGLHATLEITVNRGQYVAGQDAPAYNDNRGPRCYASSSAPNPFPQYVPGGPIQDGSTHPAAAKSANSGLSGQSSGDTQVTSPQSAALPGTGVPNSPAEAQFLGALLAPGMGIQPQDFPGWGTELVGPLYRGTEVSVK